jgi:hypothetical protein
MKRFVWIFLATSIALLSSSANADTAATAPTGPCKGYMPAGTKFAGQCADLSEHMTVSRVSEADKEKLADELGRKEILNTANYEVVDNFGYADGKFSKAIIPIRRIKDMVYQEVNLLPTLPIAGKKVPDPVTVSHSQLRYEMSPDGPPVQVIDESVPGHPKLVDIPKGEGKDDVVFSLWAIRAQGHQETFNPLHGETGYYAATYALQGYQEATKWIIQGNYPSQQFLLARNAEQSQAAFSYALDIADKNRMKNVYDTAVNSCSNAVFDVALHSFFNEDNPSGNPLEWANKSLQSIEPINQFNRYHMIDNSVHLPSIEAENQQANNAVLDQVNRTPESGCPN